VAGVGTALLDLLTGGSALAALGRVALAVCALVLGLTYRRYLGILGADRRKPAERQAYDALREGLAQGNLAARLYAERLSEFLDWIDRFFGDAGMADRTLFPHAFGLRTTAPLWTAPAFDRCLLLALIYPIVTIFAIWAVSGHVGPAEASPQLAPNMLGWRRGLTGMLFVIMMVAVVRYVRTGLRSLGWMFLAVAGGAAIAFAGGATVSGAHGITGAIGVVGASVVASAGAFVFASDLAFGGAGAIFIAGFIPVGVVDAVAGAMAYAVAVALALSVALTAAICGAVLWASATTITRGWQGPFLLFFVAMMITACLVAARLPSSLHYWEEAGPWLLFLGLLTLLNAPFDWASLGLTRALLRRGLELGGWWPYALALVDAGLAALIIAALALTMVVGVQAFDALAVHGGGKPVLPLDALFNGIAAHPSAPEYWWLYALLLSTMIPSLVNLVIGGTSLVRGLPGVPSQLLRKIPERGNVPKFDRAWIAATVLTAQVAVGAALGIAAQGFLVVVIIGYVMPWIGADLLDMARGVARVGQLFGVGL
jgi:hypothetical protein